MQLLFNQALQKDQRMQSNVGEISGRNLREKVVQCGRNTGDILKAFNDNPYSKSLNSVA